jgi:integrase
MDRMINRENYQLVEQFLTHLARKTSQKSVDRYRFYMRPLLLWSMETPLSRAHTVTPEFPAYVATQESPRGGPLAQETQKKIFMLARQFFEWAKLENPIQFREIRTNWIGEMYPQPIASFHNNPPIDMNLLADDSGDEINHKIKYVTYDEVAKLAHLPQPDGDLARWRDCAMAALLYLSAARARAAVTLPIGAIHLDQGKIRQWPELGVETKNGKRATTYLHNIPDLMGIVQSWDTYVRTHLPISAPWYAPIDSQWGEQRLSTELPGKNRSIALNKRLRLLFNEAGIQYRSAHAFRHGYAVYGLPLCRTMADLKSISSNMMHKTLIITDGIYIHQADKEIRERIRNLAKAVEFNPDANFHEYLAGLSKDNQRNVIVFLAEQLAK